MTGVQTCALPISLFSEAGPSGVIGEERLIGLLGELLTLEALLANQAPGDLTYWKGPNNEAQDFRTQNNALEVKSTLVREGRIISISSVDQLHPPPNADLCLIHHRLERDPGGFNISDLVQRLVSMGASASALQAGLAENGVDASNLKAYVARRYRSVETRTYAVTGFAFPRITRNSFVGGDIPAGTLRLSYSIDLTNEPPSPLSPSEANDVLHQLAKEAAHGMDT